MNGEVTVHGPQRVDQFEKCGLLDLGHGVTRFTVFEAADINDPDGIVVAACMRPFSSKGVFIGNDNGHALVFPILQLCRIQKRPQTRTDSLTDRPSIEFIEHIHQHSFPGVYGGGQTQQTPHLLKMRGVLK